MHSQREPHPFGPWILNSAIQISIRQICLADTGTNCILVTLILSIHVQFINRHMDLFDALLQNDCVYSLCHVQPLITVQTEQQRTYIKKTNIKYKLLSITEKLHISNTVDAIKISFTKKNRRPLHLVCHLQCKTVLSPLVNSTPKVNYNRYLWGGSDKNKVYIHQLCWQ